jgi:excisionase family DNA binding protein
MVTSCHVRENNKAGPVMSKYLTTKEVAAQARCTTKTIHNAVHSGALKAFKPAKKLLIAEADVRAWIERAAVVPLMDERLRK